MANFIKKMVDRAKSRSKSPVKHRNNGYYLMQQQYRREPYYWGSPTETYSYPVYPSCECRFQPYLGNYTPYPEELHRRDCFMAMDAPQWYHTPATPTTSPQFLHVKPLAPVSNAESSNEENRAWNTSLPVGTSPHSTTSRHSGNADLHKEPIISVPSSPKHGDSSVDVQFEALDSLASRAQQHYSNTSIPSIKQNDFSLNKIHISRPRSTSPQKTPQTSLDQTSKKSRSKSPIKRPQQISHTLDYLSPQCHSEGCSAALIVQDTKFLVCKHQLSHASDYFRALFLANKSVPISGAYQSACNEFGIIVSSFTHPPPDIQFKWFLESAIQAPVLSDITDDTLETCMRLSKRFRAKGVEMRCARYIQDNVSKRTPMVALCWLNWVLKHKFDRTTHDACLPCVAAASLQCLEEHRNMITEKLLADLLAAKLRTVYDQAVNVFQTIHSMDHFYVDVDKCPRCGRQQEQGKVRIQASPCRKLLGCERCLKEYGCNLNSKNCNDFQAYYQCEHGLVPMNEHTADCQCQIPVLASHLRHLEPHLLSLTNNH